MFLKMQATIVLVFGAVIFPRIFENFTGADWIFSLIALFVIRPGASPVPRVRDGLEKTGRKVIFSNTP
jgi:hypothetical protein